MFNLINKKLVLAMVANKAGVPRDYLEGMVTKAEALFPSVKVDDLLLNPERNVALIDQYADWMIGGKADLTADYIVAALETIDPEGRAFDLIAYASELPILDLAGEYKDVADFCKNGVFPSLLKYRSMDPESSICPDCFSSDCEKLEIRGELINFCNNCGGK